MSNKQNILDRYQEKLLGVGNGRGDNFYLQDFLDQKSLVEFISNTYDHSTTFTKDGFNFIEEYYGLEEVIKMVLKEYPEFPFNDHTAPIDFLKIKKEFALDIDELNKN